MGLATIFAASLPATDAAGQTGFQAPAFNAAVPSGSDWYQIRTRSGYYITTLERERISGDGIEGMGYTQTNDTRTFIYIIDNIGDGTHSYQLQNRHYVNKEGLVPSYPTTIPHIPLESYTYRI